MKIRSIRAYRQMLALKRPYTIARETISASEIVFFEVELFNGIIGIGAANTEPAVVGETADMTIANLQSDRAGKLIGQDIRQCFDLIARYREQFAGYPGTQAAIDIALHDAFGQWMGISVLNFYGRRHHKMLTSVTIGIKNVSETLEEAKEYRDRGFKALKVKTGLDSDEDVERIIRLREKFGQHFAIRVDANTGYDAKQLQNFLAKTNAQKIELIEQPFLPSIDAQILQLPTETRAILAADESLKDASSAMKIANDQSYGIFNIKLMKCGGIAAAQEIANIAKPANISLFWGCNDESMVSITAALHAALSCPHTRYLDLDGSLDLAEDRVTGGFKLKDGYLSPSDAPGLGLIRI